MDKVTSPCIKVCVIEDNLCKGCFRTLDEIAQWRNLSDTEKEQVIKNSKRRNKNNE